MEEEIYMLVRDFLDRRREARETRLELFKDLSDSRREILVNLFNSKESIEGLLSREFFKDLLIFYKELESIDGFDSWIELYRESLSEDCEDCISGKMRLLESLIYRLGESRVLDSIDRLNRSREKYLELWSFLDE